MGTHPVSSQSGSGLHTPAFLAACGAALVGALIWGLIAYVTEYELGYIAWGIGLLVGLVAVKFGGRGLATAATCAALTLVAIMGGKLLGTQLIVGKAMSSAEKEEYLPQELYDELGRDAVDYAALPDRSPETLAVFMIEHAYVDFETPGEVTDEDVAGFRRHSAPTLEWLHAEQPSFAAWQDRYFENMRQTYEAEFSLASTVIDNLTAIDLIFAFLAVSTAFGMINRAGRDAGEDRVLETPPSSGDQTRRAA